MKKPKTVNFCKGSIFKNLLTLFIPLLIAFFFNMAFDINDSLWIGNLLGAKAMAAQTVSLPVILTYNSLCMGATGGIAILLSHHIGAKAQREIDSTISTGFISTLAFSVLLMIICELSITGILHTLGTPASIFKMAQTFLAIHMLSFPFAMLYMYFNAVLRSYGNSMVQLTAIIFCTTLNAAFDPLFIHFMGMSGVALATVLAEGFMVLLVAAYCIRSRVFQMKLHTARLTTLKSISEKAIPSMVQQSLPAISTSFITSIVSAFGVLPLAGFGTAGRIEILLLYPPMALNMAMTSATGQCFGANLKKRAIQYTKQGLVVGSALLICIMLLATAFSRNLAVLFGAGHTVSEIVVGYFLIISVGYICNAITNCMLGTINGFGKPMSAMFLMIFYYLLVRMPLAKLLSITSLGLRGIWFAVLISHIAAALASCLYVYFVIHRRKLVPVSPDKSAVHR